MKKRATATKLPAIALAIRTIGRVFAFIGCPPSRKVCTDKSYHSTEAAQAKEAFDLNDRHFTSHLPRLVNRSCGRIPDKMSSSTSTTRRTMSPLFFTGATYVEFEFPSVGLVTGDCPQFECTHFSQMNSQ